MKRFLQVVIAMKERAALCYSGAMCMLLFFLFCFGQRSASLPMLFSVLLASAAAGVLQVAAFSELIVKKLSYGGRMLLFVIPYFVLLTAIGAIFDWFPVRNGWAWALWVIFFVAFLFITIGFTCFYRRCGRRYDGLLGLYRQKKGE